MATYGKKEMLKGSSFPLKGVRDTIHDRLEGNILFGRKVLKKRRLI